MSQISEAAQKSKSAPALRPSIFYFLVFVVFLGDQISKYGIQKRLSLGESVPILKNAFHLTLAYNTGGAWGMLPSSNHLFTAFALTAVLAILFAYHRAKNMDIFMAAAFALALGGACGNLLDRLRYGYVVDFFDARIIRWPIFNVADSGISIGIILLVVYFFRSAREEAQIAKRQKSLEDKP